MSGLIAESGLETSSKNTDYPTAQISSSVNDTCKDTTKNKNDIMIDSGTVPDFKSPHYRIKRTCRRNGPCGNLICYHGIHRSVCKTCDPVGYKISRIRSCVYSGLKRVGTVKNKKTLRYLGVESFDYFIQNMQGKMDLYNTKNPHGVQMTFENIHIDHIKPAKAFGDEINHYTNLQPLLSDMNMLKKAKWSQQDELFWRENIQNQPDYTEIYLGVGVNTSYVPEEKDAMTGSYLDKHGFVVKAKKPEKMVIRKNISEKCRNDLADQLLLWQANKPTCESEFFDDILCKLHGIQNTLQYSNHINPIDSPVFRAKTRLNEVITTYRALGNSNCLDRVNNLFLYDVTFQNHENIILAMYTLERIKQIQKHAQTLDYNLPNAQTACLLHELITVFNNGLLPPSRIRMSDLSLRQNAYNEDEEIGITDTQWGLFSHNCRAVKIRPSTRRELMDVIFALSVKIFGKCFTDKRETSRIVKNSETLSKTKKCYNYVGKCMSLSVYVRMTDWSKHELSDFEPHIVSKYKLDIRQRRDILIRDAQDPKKLKQQQLQQQLQQKILDQINIKKQNALKRKAVLLGTETSPKRPKL